MKQLIKQKILFFLLVIPALSISQVKQDTPKLRPPQMKTYWGNQSGGKISVNEIISILKTPLVVFANNKEKLHISRAIFVYRSKDAIEDEKTGEIRYRYNSSAYNFRNIDRLPEVWISFLTESIKSGDQIHIAEIMVKNKNNEIFIAPDIRFSIE